ncbi:MAG: HIRAN domain-containing protein [Fusobacteriaceae bacterium]|jgi:hypothetical protein|nr:HIRAN domain-containing protein [Fusobacteriaceae bacterium]
MSDLIKTDMTNIISIINSKNSIDLTKPFSQEIFLLSVYIAGTTHIKNLTDLEKNITKGNKINFYREPENIFDPRAIVVKDGDGNKLGYIPKDKNDILARLMDAGKLLYGIVKEKNKVGKWTKIQVEIFLSD